MKFGDHIQRQREQDVDWGIHYLKYDDLKALLERTRCADDRNDHDDEEEGDKDKENGRSMASSSQIIMNDASRKTAVTEEFSRQLYYEMERIVLFVYEQQGQIATDLAAYRIIIEPMSSNPTSVNSILGTTSTTNDKFLIPRGFATNSHHPSGGGLFIDPPEPTNVVVGDDEYSIPILRPDDRPTRAAQQHQQSELSQRYCETGRAIIHLYRFVDVNVTGIRKILKKHDKLMMKDGGGITDNLGELFLTPPTHLMKQLTSSLHGGSSSSPRLWSSSFSLSQYQQPPPQPTHRTFALAASQMIQPLLHEEYLNPLVVALESGVRAFLLLQQQQYCETATGTGHVGTHRRSMSELQSERLQSRSFSELATMSYSPVMMQHHRKKGGVFRKSSASLNTTTTDTSYLPPSDVNVMLAQVRAAQRRLRQQTSHFVHFLAAPMLVARQGSSDYDNDIDDASAPSPHDDDDHDDCTEREDRSRISNWLNLFSTVFFMTNYYIVAPTSGNYAHLLGGNAALASLIIGMTPLAALVSTILYSWWTSYSYKHALIFASVCSTIGNLFYAAGLPCNSLTLVLIGRMLNGFGSARSINRRYIADTFSRADRTAASAAFVTAGAMGMAAGPLLASLLHMIVVLLPNNEHNLYLQSENAPGWFMFCVWVTYLVCLIVYFQDPPRKNIIESSVTFDKPVRDETETSPLLVKDGATHTSKPTSDIKQQSSLWTNVPVMVTLFVCAVLKLQNEAVLCAAANLATFYFRWTPSFVGLYMASLGLMMLPANLIVGYYARRREDRDLIIGLLVIMVLGGFLMLDYGAYTMAQYMVASFMLFVASTAIEGPNMSLLSKSIPTSWSQGVFNVGLLATESGTFGRTVADALLTLFGSDGIEHLLNRTFVAATLVSITALAICCRYFDRLRTLDREE